MAKGGIRLFLKEVNQEIKKTTWPNRKQLFTASSVVIVILIVTGLYFALLDIVFARLTRALLVLLGI